MDANPYEASSVPTTPAVWPKHWMFSLTIAFLCGALFGGGLVCILARLAWATYSPVIYPSE